MQKCQGNKPKIQKKRKQETAVRARESEGVPPALLQILNYRMKPNLQKIIINIHPHLAPAVFPASFQVTLLHLPTLPGIICSTPATSAEQGCGRVRPAFHTCPPSASGPANPLPSISGEWIPPPPGEIHSCLQPQPWRPLLLQGLFSIQKSFSSVLTAFKASIRPSSTSCLNY